MNTFGLAYLGNTPGLAYLRNTPGGGTQMVWKGIGTSGGEIERLGAGIERLGGGIERVWGGIGTSGGGIEKLGGGIARLETGIERVRGRIGGMGLRSLRVGLNGRRGGLKGFWVGWDVRTFSV